MNNKVTTFVLGIYISISVSVSGYLYINPIDYRRDRTINGSNGYLDYTEFKYSVLISIVGFILLYSILQFFKKKKY